MIGWGVRSVRRIIPPLIAPGSVGIWFSSTATVRAIV